MQQYGVQSKRDAGWMIRVDAGHNSKRKERGYGGEKRTPSKKAHHRADSGSNRAANYHRIGLRHADIRQKQHDGQRRGKWRDEKEAEVIDIQTDKREKDDGYPEKPSPCQGASRTPLRHNAAPARERSRSGGCALL